MEQAPLGDRGLRGGGVILQRFYHEGLAHASYLVGCPGAGEAVVIDPNRDIEPYIAAAAKEGMRIVAAADTHIHADYISGVRELSHATGATMILSDEGGTDWKYAFADDPLARLVRDGDTFRVGRVRFDVVKTEGHTPEHIAFVVTDEAASCEPLGAFTGDFLFVGDVGRPDLLEQAAGVVGTQEPGARALFRSLNLWRSYPDHLLIWPAHGAGSACGKSLGGVPVSSLGYERATNWGLRTDDEEMFVAEVLSGQPEPPVYFKEMKRLNKLGAPILGSMPHPSRLQDPERLRESIGGGALVIDVRPASEFILGLLAGSINIPTGRTFVNWAGWFTPYDKDVMIVAPDEEAAAFAAREMAMIGLDNVIGWVGPEDLALVGPLESIEAGSPTEAGPSALVLDVRGRSEREGRNLPWAMHMPLGFLPRHIDEIPRDRTVLIHCESGGRAVIAASLLRRAGVKDVRPIRASFAEIQAIQLAGTGTPGR